MSSERAEGSRRRATRAARFARRSGAGRGARAGAGRAGAGTGCVCLGTRGEVPELALQRGDRHRVQANKPNTTSSTALQNFTSALSRSSLVRRIKKLNGISSVIYEKRHVVVRRSTARLSLV